MAGETIVIKKKKRGGHAGGHGGAWKVAYADFVTAMMCFFLVMWLMGSDEEIKAAVSHYFNHPNTPYHEGKDPKSDVAHPLGEKEGQGDAVVNGMNGFWPADLVERPRPHKDVMRENITISKLIQDLLEGEIYGMDVTKDSVRFSLPEKVLFKPGTNNLVPGFEKDLDTLADLLKNFSGHIAITGHTDSAAPRGGYSNNWELSMARALTVMDYLKQHGIKENKMIPVARANTLPFTTKADPNEQAKNRRVEFTLTYDE